MDEYQPTHYVAVENEFEHGIVKTLFNRITIKLRRDWFQSMHVIAMLIWLEKAIFHGSIKKFVALPHDKMDQLVDEALICLNVIENPITFPETIQFVKLPVMQRIIKMDMLLLWLYNTRFLAFQGVKSAMKDVFIVINQRAQSQPPRSNGCFQLQPRTTHVSSSQSLTDPSHERTIFMTFSNRYRISRWEVRDFFCREYGEDYVQKITMKDSLVIGQARYARVLFQNFETVERILNGGEKVELVIHGKIVRARRFKKFEK